MDKKTEINLCKNDGNINNASPVPILSKLNDLFQCHTKLQEYKTNQNLKYNELHKKYQTCIQQNEYLKKQNNNLVNLTLKYKAFIEEYCNMSSTAPNNSNNCNKTADNEMKTLSDNNNNNINLQDNAIEKLLNKNMNSFRNNCPHLIERILCGFGDPISNKIDNNYIINIVRKCIFKGIITKITHSGIMECKYQNYTTIISKQFGFIHDLVFCNDQAEIHSITLVNSIFKEMHYFKVKQICFNAKATNNYFIKNDKGFASYVYRYNKCLIVFASNHRTVKAISMSSNINDLYINDNGLSDKYMAITNKSKTNLWNNSRSGNVSVVSKETEKLNYSLSKSRSYSRSRSSRTRRYSPHHVLRRYSRSRSRSPSTSSHRSYYHKNRNTKYDEYNNSKYSYSGSSYRSSSRSRSRTR